MKTSLLRARRPANVPQYRLQHTVRDVRCSRGAAQSPQALDARTTAAVITACAPGRFSPNAHPILAIRRRRGGGGTGRSPQGSPRRRPADELRQRGRRASSAALRWRRRGWGWVRRVVARGGRGASAETTYIGTTLGELSAVRLGHATRLSFSGIVAHKDERVASRARSGRTRSISSGHSRTTSNAWPATLGWAEVGVPRRRQAPAAPPLRWVSGSFRTRERSRWAPRRLHR
jgi:hypothetical protein